MSERMIIKLCVFLLSLVSIFGSTWARHNAPMHSFNEIYDYYFMSSPSHDNYIDHLMKIYVKSPAMASALRVCKRRRRRRRRRSSKILFLHFRLTMTMCQRTLTCLWGNCYRSTKAQRQSIKLETHASFLFLLHLLLLLLRAIAWCCWRLQ